MSIFACFSAFSFKSKKIAWILLPLNCNFSGLGWDVLDFSKPVGRGGFGAHSNSKLVSQFLQTIFMCHKMSQNSTVFSVSYSSDCRWTSSLIKKYTKNLVQVTWLTQIIGLRQKIVVWTHIPLQSSKLTIFNDFNFTLIIITYKVTNASSSASNWEKNPKQQSFEVKP